MHGRTVGLAEGLRQGCVLSPIMYCTSINCFLSQAPTDVGAPACAEEVVKELYSQGLQDVDCDEAGAVNPSLGRMARAFLFTDDTTLVARTKAGLKTLARRYLNFCKQFRMRLNHGKSKVMHFRRGRYRTDVNAGFAVDGLSFEEPEAKKPLDGGGKHT